MFLVIKELGDLVAIDGDSGHISRLVDILLVGKVKKAFRFYLGYGVSPQDKEFLVI